jgi:uroporphyrin-III C-methyltransferase
MTPTESEVTPRPVPSASNLPVTLLRPDAHDTWPRWALWLLAAVAALALLTALMLWQRLGSIQKALAQQSFETQARSVEAQALAKAAQEVAREAAARVAVAEAKVGEVAVQREQLEDLIQSLSRSRDENMVVDIDSALRLALQQSQLTGSVQPLLAALQSAEQRVQRAGQPRLGTLQRALARDIERVKSAAVADMPQLVLQIDELSRSVDELPLVNAVGSARQPAAPPKPVASAASAASPAATKKGAASAANTPASANLGLKTEPLASLWQNAWNSFWGEMRQLVRVGRIDTPEAALLAPEQAFFLRENLKLKLLNARLALLSRQFEPARADLLAANQALNKYYDTNARSTQNALALLAKVQTQARQLELPRIDETLAALTTAAAAR